MPRLCRPYRAKTKGKVERFVGYLKRSFWVPFVATCRQTGLRPDAYAANAAVAVWLRDVANALVHATTGEVPAERLMLEREHLKPLHRPYRGRPVRPPQPIPAQGASRGYQHPLSAYDDLILPSAQFGENTVEVTPEVVP